MKHVSLEKFVTIFLKLLKLINEHYTVCCSVLFWHHIYFLKYIDFWKLRFSFFFVNLVGVQRPPQEEIKKFWDFSS